MEGTLHDSEKGLHKAMWWPIVTGTICLLYVYLDSYAAVLADVVGVFFTYVAYILHIS